MGECGTPTGLNRSPEADEQPAVAHDAMREKLPLGKATPRGGGKSPRLASLGARMGSPRVFGRASPKASKAGGASGARPFAQPTAKTIACALARQAANRQNDVRRGFDTLEEMAQQKAVEDSLKHQRVESYRKMLREQLVDGLPPEDASKLPAALKPDWYVTPYRLRYPDAAEIAARRAAEERALDSVKGAASEGGGSHPENPNGTRTPSALSC